MWTTFAFLYTSVLFSEGTAKGKMKSFSATNSDVPYFSHMEYLSEVNDR
jgi:hypothetical protein